MNRPTAARRNTRVHTGLRPTVLAAALILLAPWSSAQKLDGGLPPGLVSEDALKSKEKALAEAQRKLDDANDRLRRLEAQAKTPVKPTPQPDPETVARLQKTETELAQARQRIAQLEAQLKTLETQRDEALADAKAAARKNNAADGKAEVALRRERDRIKEERDETQRRYIELKGAVSAIAASQGDSQRAAIARASGIAGVQSEEETRAFILGLFKDESKGASAGAELTAANCGANCPSFIVLPQAGRVTMGTGSEAHTVDFKHRLAMGKTEVTVAQWRHFINDSRHNMPNDWEKNAVSERHPVLYVSALDADAYAKWFNGKYAAQLGLPKLQVVLPTEDEWEYAARAGRWTQERQWDSGIRDGKENCDFAGSANCTGSTPDPVAKTGRKPNAWGLYDTIGNVWEWTSTASGGGSRVVRGGSFGSSGDSLGLSARHAGTADVRDGSSGLRLLARIDL